MRAKVLISSKLWQRAFSFVSDYRIIITLMNICICASLHKNIQFYVEHDFGIKIFAYRATRELARSTKLIYMEYRFRLELKCL